MLKLANQFLFKGYKLYDLEKKKFVVSRDVQFFEQNFDHFEKIRSKDAVQADMGSIFPDADQESENVTQHPLLEEPAVPEDVEPPVQKNVEPAVPENVEPAVPQIAEPVEVPNEEAPVQRTYELFSWKKFLPPVRERRMPSRFCDEDCLLVDSEIDEPKTVQEALNVAQSVQWREAMESEYSFLLKNDTWDLVPPLESKNIVGSRWILKVKCNKDGGVDRFKARLAALGYSKVKGVDYDEVFSLVARYTFVRSLLALANAHDLGIRHIDVKTAFLNGSLDCEMYTSQPEGFVDPDRPDQAEKEHLWT